MGKGWHLQEPRQHRCHRAGGTGGSKINRNPDREMKRQFWSKSDTRQESSVRAKLKINR